MYKEGFFPPKFETFLQKPDGPLAYDPVTKAPGTPRGNAAAYPVEETKGGKGKDSGKEGKDNGKGAKPAWR